METRVHNKRLSDKGIKYIISIQQIKALIIHDQFTIILASTFIRKSKYGCV